MREHFLKIFINSEAFISELPENIDEMFPWYYMHSGVNRNLKSTDTQ